MKALVPARMVGVASTIMLATVACSDSVAPVAPAALQPVSGGGQSGAVGQALPQQLVVKVVDAAGRGS